MKEKFNIIKSQSDEPTHDQQVKTKLLTVDGFDDLLDELKTLDKETAIKVFAKYNYERYDIRKPNEPDVPRQVKRARAFNEMIVKNLPLKFQLNVSKFINLFL